VTLEPLGILLAAAFTTASSLAAGGLLLEWVGLRLPRPERLLFSFATGSSLLSLGVFLLAALRIARWETFLAAGAGLIAWSAWKGGWRRTESPFPPLPRIGKFLFFAVFVLFTYVYFIWSLAPELSPDGSSYHLGLVARYLRERGFASVPVNMYAYLSQGLEMLFLFAFAFGRHSAAALVHFTFLAALPWAMVCYGQRFGFPAPALAAALLVYLSPVVGVDGASAYNDVAVAFVVFVVFYLVELWIETREPALLIPIGLLAGFAFAIKYTAFLVLPFALIAVAARLARDRGRMIRAAVVVAGAASVMIAPWLGKNLVTVGNPVAPFFNRWFPNSHVFIEFEEIYSSRLRSYDLPDRRLIPLEATVRGGALGGFLGPVFLLTPLGLFALGSTHGRRLLLAGAVFALPYFGNIGTRFLIPCLPFFSLALALALGASGRVAALAVAVHAVLSWPPNHSWYARPEAWRIARVPLRAALRLESEHDYLSFRLPQYGIARLIEEQVPPDGKVLAINSVAEAYTTREILIGYQSARGNTMQQILWSPHASHYQPAGRMRFRFPAASLSAVRVVQTGRGLADWGVNELRFYRGAAELERSPRWRLRARPNPWDVQMAFDNSAVTPWRARQWVFPGMFVEADFGQPEMLDSALIECACDVWNLALRLEGRAAAGGWRVLTDQAERFEIEAPPWLRRQASAAIKALGVDYLLIHDSDYYAGDFRSHSRLWGLRPLGERNGGRLYFIE
jgi:hypothetical protein